MPKKAGVPSQTWVTASVAHVATRTVPERMRSAGREGKGGFNYLRLRRFHEVRYLHSLALTRER
jgi:hypothetical protein